RRGARGHRRARRQRSRGRGHSREAQAARARGVQQGAGREDVQEPGAGCERGVRQRSDQARGVRGHGWRLRLPRLPGHRRALPGTGGRPRQEAPRGDASSHPAARLRKGDVRADLAARRHGRLRPARGRVRAGTHHRLSVLGPVRRREASSKVMRILTTLLLLGLLLLAPSTRIDHATRADAPTTALSRAGTLGGAHYQIEVPADWRGGLVVYAHGIQRGPGPGAVTSPPLATHILGEGHAWAASGYRTREY